ncbi:hypothetical protein D9M71_549580 [compost metagenome]
MLLVAAQGRGRGEAGADHAEHPALVRIDHHHAAGDEILELHIDHVGAVRAGREREDGLADALVGGQVGEGAVHAGQRHAQGQRCVGEDPVYSHQVGLPGFIGIGARGIGRVLQAKSARAGEWGNCSVCQTVVWVCQGIVGGRQDMPTIGCDVAGMARSCRCNQPR